jgi:DNA-binding response OmpR family regulator
VKERKALARLKVAVVVELKPTALRELVAYVREQARRQNGPLHTSLARKSSSPGLRELSAQLAERELRQPGSGVPGRQVAG